MALVSQKQMWFEVFELMQDHKVRTRSQIADAIKTKLSLTEDEMQEKTSSGVAVYKSRSDWSVSQLNIAGLLDRPTRAHYQISDIGFQKYNAGINVDDLARFIYTSKLND